jgi:hypothetical protein
MTHGDVLEESALAEATTMTALPHSLANNSHLLRLLAEPAPYPRRF